jgi:hypothetical protein
LHRLCRGRHARGWDLGASKWRWCRH